MEGKKLLPIVLQIGVDVGALAYLFYIAIFAAIGILSFYWLYSTYVRVKRMEKVLEEIKKTQGEGPT